jgi:hypothetical protein
MIALGVHIFPARRCSTQEPPEGLCVCALNVLLGDRVPSGVKCLRPSLHAGLLSPQAFCPVQDGDHKRSGQHMVVWTPGWSDGKSVGQWLSYCPNLEMYTGW